MILAISACPMTVAQILDLADKIGKDELKIDDVVDGLLDFNEQLDARSRTTTDDDRGRGRRGPTPARSQSENLERLKVAALERFGTIRKHFTRMLAVLQKEGHKAPKYLDLQKKISAELMQIRFSARMVEKLCDSRAHRGRQHPPASSARSRTSSSTRAACRARTSSRRSRPTRRRCAGSTARFAAHHNYSEQLAQVPAGDRRAAAEAPRPADARDDPLEGPEGDQQADVDGRGEGAQGEARDDRGQPAPRDLDRQEVHEPRPAVPRPDPGRQHRPDEGRRQVRIPARLQVLDVRDVVDPPGDHALDRRPGAHDPHPGAHDRDDQQDEPDLAADPAGDGAGARSRDARREDGDAGGEDPQDPEDQQGADLDGDADRRRRRFASRRFHRGPVDGRAVRRRGQRVACATCARTSSTR